MALAVPNSVPVPVPLFYLIKMALALALALAPTASTLYCLYLGTFFFDGFPNKSYQL